MPALEPGDRGDVDDRAAAALDHLRDRIACHQHHAGDVDVHRLRPALHVDLQRVAARAGDADLVDPDVAAPTRAGRLLDKQLWRAYGREHRGEYVKAAVVAEK